MRKFLGLSSLFVFVILLMMQTGITSCTKDVVKIDTVTVTHTDTLTKVDTVVTQDTTVTLAILTANKWRSQEIRGVIGNDTTVYQRGGTNNTEDYDNEYIQFNTNGTGILYDAVGTTHQTTWSFLDSSHTMLTFVVFNPSPIASQTVIWDNLRYKDGKLLFDQYWSYQGINSHTQFVRIPYGQ